MSLLNQPQKIAYSIFDFNLLNYPSGPKTHILQIAYGLREANHQVRVIGLRGLNVSINDDNESQTQGKLGLSGFFPYQFLERSYRRIQELFRIPYINVFDNYRYYEACRLNLKGYHLIHERYHPLNCSGAIASNHMHIPLVLEVNADIIQEIDHFRIPMRWAQRNMAIKMTHIALNKAAVVVCVSNPLKNRLVQKWHVSPQKIIVCPNAVDTNLFSPRFFSDLDRKGLGILGHPVIMFVGNFSRWHDLNQLVEAFMYVKKEFPFAHLALVGDGNNRPDVEKSITSLGLQDSVLITGFVKNEEIPNYLASADIAVVPYPIEPPGGLWFSPLKLFEYMAAGNAIVASGIRPITEIIQDGKNGLIAQPGKAIELAKCIIKLAKDEHLREDLGKKAREDTLKFYSLKTYIKNLEKIYSSVLAEVPKR
jgi:glycosyltransferase involved in cell wall biosynthesis